MKCWTTVLERLDKLLINAGAKLNTCDNMILDCDDPVAKEMTCCVLKFLSLLLKAASDKRYYLALEVR